MRVTCEIDDYSVPTEPNIRVHNSFIDNNKVELEVEGKRYTVNADELISAVRRATLNCLDL